MVSLSLIACACLAFSLASSCVIDKSTSSCQPCAAAAVSPPCQCKPFNAKTALYEKFPLLYKLYSTKCKLFCDKINGVNQCVPAPKTVVVAAPAPAPAPAVVAAPVYASVPVYTSPQRCPACEAAGSPCAACAAAASQSTVSPDVLNALLAYSGIAAPGASLPQTYSCPCCS